MINILTSGKIIKSSQMNIEHEFETISFTLNSVDNKEVYFTLGLVYNQPYVEFSLIIQSGEFAENFDSCAHHDYLAFKAQFISKCVKLNIACHSDYLDSPTLYYQAIIDQAWKLLGTLKQL